MIKTVSAVYGAAAAWRRQWYARHPERQRRLSKPVISVGNLRVGGSGKTPVVAHIARLLLERGERPAVLSRGYGRRIASNGATVVADGARVLVDVDSAGDEPLMLARTVPGLITIVGADRYTCGLVAERRFGATVHILDDGFQHFGLARDVDLLLVGEDELTDRPMPAGRLREPIAAAARADAAIVDATDFEKVQSVAQALGIATAFRMARTLGEPRMLGARQTNAGARAIVAHSARVFAVAGIARPQRFFGDVTSAGFEVVGTLAVRDHHRFDAADAKRITNAAIAAGAEAIVTTEKDGVRLEPVGITAVPVITIPLAIAVEPAERFRAWLFERLK